MHQLGPEAGASSKAGKAGKLPQQPFAPWEQSNLQKLCRQQTPGPGHQRNLRRGRAVGAREGAERARQLAATTSTSVLPPIPIELLPPPLLHPPHLPSASAPCPLRRIGFRFTSHLDSCSSGVCLVKDLQVVIETIFWL